MGDLIDFVAYKKNKQDYADFKSEFDRLNVAILVWTPYDLAKERQGNVDWMEMFFYPDEDW